MTGVFSLGCVIERKAQRYTCVAVEPYTNRKGQLIDLFVFEAACAVCGDRFWVKIVPSTKQVNKRCPQCIAAGSRA